jgi:L-ascorbate metabolism protein UlaG (beta-lactamase superfamily)
MSEAAQLIQPVLSGGAFIADVKSAMNAGADDFNLWWLGQAGFLVQWRGHHLLLDPYLSDSLTKKYAGTDKQHVRMTGLVVDPARLDFIEAVTSSHNHTDHLDHETLWPLMKANPKLELVVPEANRAFAAERLKCDPAWLVGCDDGVTARVGAFEITGVAAAHEELERDELGRCKFLGYVVRFGPWTIYHAGDNKGWGGMAARVAELAAPRGIDVALLPINGRKPERRVPGNFWGREAAQFAAEIGAGLAVPMHYEMFTFNTETPAEFAAACAELGQPSRVLRCGERWESRRLGEAV